MRNIQKGVGLVEVLVALILLSIAVLGYVALQINAISASQEAAKNTQAMNIVRDLSERIRLNHSALEQYVASNNPKDCSANFCTTEELAKYDYNEVLKKAENLGLSMAINDCQGNATMKRKCIYVAWDGTLPTNGTASPACTNGTSYLPDARCVMVEVYNYD